MSKPATEFTLAELLICAAADAFVNDGEVLATGIGVIPRLGASLAMKSSNPDLLMTDSECFLLSEPNPVSGRGPGFVQKNESWMGLAHIFDNVWSGKRHAMVGPTQIDRFGQANISCIGSYDKPKVQMLGVRGFPGNSISHRNSFFVPSHNAKVFVDGEVDMVASVGYNPARLAKGWSLDEIDIHRIITDLCVMDFGGPNHQVRLLSLHPGVTVEQVVENTGFEVHCEGDIRETAAPTEEQLALIAALDPKNIRSKQLAGDPPGKR